MSETTRMSTGAPDLQQGRARSELLSIVIPIFNEEEIVLELLGRLRSTEATLREISIDCEFVLVNDGSSDRTLKILEEEVAKDTSLRVVNLSRNFGHQAAIQAGLSVAKGDAIVIMDGDLQDPPELIPELCQEWRKGNKVVIAKRRSRAEKGVRKLAFNSFYKVLGRMSDYPIELNAGHFSLMDKRVVQKLIALQERNRFLPGLRSWVGFEQGFVLYDREKRAGGEPKMTMSKLFRYGFDAIFSFSYKPLRAIWTLGMVVSLFCIGYAFFLIGLRVFGINVVPGFTTPTVAILFLGGVQLISVGMLGEYMGRIYDEVKQRPLFLIDEVISQDNSEDHE
jgi:glycosyltransferase involved in cell wall biosynthesis